jgi:hypothetical protein
MITHTRLDYGHGSFVAVDSAISFAVRRRAKRRTNYSDALLGTLVEIGTSAPIQHRRGPPP